MLTVVLGLAGALVYGAADFVGGLAARRISALRVTALGAGSGVVLLAAGALVIPGRWSAEALLWGGISGLTGAVAIALLYACLAIGPMSILSPLTAVTSAIVPLTWGLATGSQLGALAYPAFALALVAVVLVGFVPSQGAVRPTARGLVMATISGTLIGAFYILMAQTPDDSGLVPLIANRAVNATLMVTVIVLLAIAAGQRGMAADARLAVLDGAHGAPHAVDGPRAPGGAVGASAAALRGGWRGGIALGLLCGVLDAGANVIALLGLRLGDLEVVSVLTALYPAGTILLAALVLRERIARLLWVGLGLALAASAMLALA
ncbi:DMT family transporter [Microcella alkalica]|uniref:Putative membrane protein n=1 Tax=Microcella alkalica TaxID=355930 RepID=A0A839EB30_9MICO|nr:EamA family transporter [Microcella alkalica]MBA8848373.1 putative membrane protein [Microcella alkalica]